VSAELLTSLSANLGLSLNFPSEPNTELENPLKLYVTNAPLKFVAERMGRQVVVQFVHPAASAGHDVVYAPLVAVEETSADVAVPTCLIPDRLSVCGA
jgi:hypothetical protein